MRAAFRGWMRTHWLALGAVGLAGVAIRLSYLPDPGYVNDLNEFARLASRISELGLGRAYDAPMSFGPVVAYVWWLFGLVAPAIRDASDASAVPVTLILKLPAFVADLGLAALVVVALRARPVWAIAGASIILLHPVVWFLSAWWGQYESVFVFLALLALVLALHDRPLLAAAALTAAILTKPQALAFGLPFAAWYLARYDARTIIRSALAAGATAIALWLPFAWFDGPSRYLELLAHSHDERFGFLSMVAWNVWWIVQREVLDVAFQPDQATLLGPVTYRMAGYVATAVLALVVAYPVWRRPTPARFALSLAASTLVAFTFLTTMHERYSYAAVVFLALLPDRRRILAFSVPLGALIMWNLLAAASFVGLLDWRWESGGLPGIVGSVGLIVATFGAAALVWLEGPADRSALAASVARGRSGDVTGPAPG